MSGSSLHNGFSLAAAFTEDGQAARLDGTVDIVDASLDALNDGTGDYAGARLVLERFGGADPSDLFSFDLTDAGFTVQGSALFAGGHAFATFAQENGSLTITFTSVGTTATSALADAVARSIAYANVSDNPTDFVALLWTFTNGLGERSRGLTGVEVEVVNDAPSFDQVTFTRGATFEGESAGDNFGFSVAALGDIDGDGVPDLIAGAPFDDNTGLNAGSARVISGADGSTIYTFNGNSADDRFGSLVASAGDVNGDGIGDIIIGAFQSDTNGTESGSVSVFSGADGTQLHTFHGAEADELAGFSAASAGDVNGDGFADIIVGAYGADANGLNSGAARVYSGLDGSLLYTFAGDSAGDHFGISVAGAGDVDGDGHADLIIGAWRDDNGGNDTGSARVISGATGAILYTFNGDSPADFFGYSVAGAGDVNGDGHADVIIGAFGDDNNGSASGSTRVISGVDGTLLYTFSGFSTGDVSGFAVAAARKSHSTVTDFARFRGWSTSVPFSTAT